MDLLRRIFHRHDWRDWYVFDSCIEHTVPSGEIRILGQAVMQRCDHCGASQRRPLKTWREARAVRKLIPYARYGQRTTV